MGIRNQMSEILKLSNLSKSYGDLQVLKGIDLSVKNGEVVVILGPSGCGKSTTLRCINGLEPFDGGQIEIAGEKIDKDYKDWIKIRQKVGMVFQNYELFDHMNVIENIVLGPVKAQKRSREEVEKEAEAWLEKVGLKHKKYAYPKELSGGQKQRIAIARSLAVNPDVILFDEPTSALDPEMIGEVLGIMKEVAKEGITMLVVTHEMGFARNVANRIFFMEGGKIAVDDTPKNVFENPQNPRLKEFLNKILNH